MPFKVNLGSSDKKNKVFVTMKTMAYLNVGFQPFFYLPTASRPEKSLKVTKKENRLAENLQEGVGTTSPARTDLCRSEVKLRPSVLYS